MNELVLFARIGLMLDDILAVISVVGCAILFLGAILSRHSMKTFGEFANWSVVALAFGMLGQLSIAITDMPVDKIGFVFQLSPLIVNGLLVLSFLLLSGRWLVGRTRR